ncbi:hypothetical protein chiPu_0015226 [Chiloscyllium punctatum]|uniref:Uncharacterized protein n=1 Tax=Chiloscyllium punctatum TaxID=137246 RepID=A0A401T281_CHIPU|nr:hypothetical protein [Chiloscyllium punctatum]
MCLFKRKQRKGESQMEDELVNGPFQPVYTETFAKSLTQSVPEPKDQIIEGETSSVFIPGLATKKKNTKKNKIAVSPTQSTQKKLFEKVQDQRTLEVTPNEGKQN